MKIIQDGREFYNDETGDMVFESSLVVPDGDIDAAAAARDEFRDYCRREDIAEIEWV